MFNWFKKNQDKNSLTIVIGQETITKTRGTGSLFTVSTINGKQIPWIGRLPLKKQYTIIISAFMLFLVTCLSVTFYASIQKNKYEISIAEADELIDSFIAFRGALSQASDGNDDAFINAGVIKNKIENHFIYLKSPSLTDEAVIHGLEKANWDSDSIRLALENFDEFQETVWAVKKRGEDLHDSLMVSSNVLKDLYSNDFGLDETQKQNIKQAFYYFEKFRVLVTEKQSNITADSAAKEANFALDNYMKFLNLANEVAVGKAKTNLDALSGQYKENLSGLNPLIKRIEEKQKTKDVLAVIVQSTDNSEDAINKVRSEIKQKERNVNQLYYFAFLCFIMMVGLVGLMLAVYNQENKRKNKEAVEANNASSQAILSLLDEIGNLASGDLRVRASVSEEITGAIADSMNYAIAGMGELVKEIQRSSDQISNASSKLKRNADGFKTINFAQQKDVKATGAAVLQITESIDKVSKRVEDSKRVALASVESSNKGLEAVITSISGIKSIQSNVDETGKRIRRLTEQSNQISEIVDLIADISEKTQVLAMNAMIQADKAGAAGKGFKVVADAVQELANQANGATKRISGLIHAIQTDIQGAGVAMEKTTEEANRGVMVAETTGEALNEIHEVATTLSGIVADLNEQIAASAKAASEVSSTMKQVSDSTKQSIEASKETGRAIEEINEYTAKLKNSVAGFKV